MTRTLIVATRALFFLDMRASSGKLWNPDLEGWRREGLVELGDLRSSSLAGKPVPGDVRPPFNLANSDTSASIKDASKQLA